MPAASVGRSAVQGGAEISSRARNGADRAPDAEEGASQHPEASLLAKLRAGDADAFAQIVRSWSPMMLRVARTYVSTDASAQELVQDAWLAVIRGLAGFEGRSLLRTWVLAILANLGRSRGPREARTVPWSSLTLVSSEEPAVDRTRFRDVNDRWPKNWTSVGAPRPWPTPEDETLAAEFHEELAAALEELPEQQRVVVSLRDVHGLSSEEVCSLLNLSAGNQRLLLHRARSRLRGHLETRYVVSATAAGS